MKYIIEYEDGIYFATCDDFLLYGIGSTKEDAILNLKEHFNYFKDHYISTSDHKLTREALKLKGKFIGLV